MIADFVEHVFVAGVTIGAGDDGHVGCKRAHLRVRGLGHWGGVDHAPLAVGEHREVGVADGLRVCLGVCSGCRVAAAPLVDAKEKAEVELGLGDEVILFGLEATCLLCAACSPRGGEVEDVVLTEEVVDVDFLAALIDQAEVGHHVADLGAG